MDHNSYDNQNTKEKMGIYKHASLDYYFRIVVDLGKIFFRLLVSKSYINKKFILFCVVTNLLYYAILLMPGVLGPNDLRHIQVGFIIPSRVD